MSIEALEALEALLEETGKKGRFTVYLATIGGCGMSDNLRRMMGRLVSNNMSLNLNLHGLRGKKPFNSYRTIIGSISEAVRSHFTATDKEVRRYQPGTGGRLWGNKLK